MATGDRRARARWIAGAGVCLAIAACGGGSPAPRGASPLDEPCAVSCLRIENGCAAQTESMCFLYGPAVTLCGHPERCTKAALPCRHACRDPEAERDGRGERCERSCVRWEAACAQHADRIDEAYPYQDPCDPRLCPPPGAAAPAPTVCLPCVQTRAQAHAQQEARRGDARAYCAKVAGSCRSFCLAPRARASSLWQELGYPRPRPRAEP